MRKLVLIIIVGLCGVCESYAAIPGLADFSERNRPELNRRKKYPFGINAVAFGPVGLASITADWFVTPKVGIELGGGFRDFNGDHAFTIGARYHLFGKSMLNITPYIGIYSVFHHNGSDLQSHGVYIPAGLHRIKKNRFNWSAEVAWQRNLFSGNGFSGSFKIGYRF